MIEHNLRSVDMICFKGSEGLPMDIFLQSVFLVLIHFTCSVCSAGFASLPYWIKYLMCIWCSDPRIRQRCTFQSVSSHVSVYHVLSWLLTSLHMLCKRVLCIEFRTAVSTSLVVLVKPCNYWQHRKPRTTFNGQWPDPGGKQTQRDSNPGLEDKSQMQCQSAIICVRHVTDWCILTQLGGVSSSLLSAPTFSLLIVPACLRFWLPPGVARLSQSRCHFQCAQRDAADLHFNLAGFLKISLWMPLLASSCAIKIVGTVWYWLEGYPVKCDQFSKGATLLCFMLQYGMMLYTSCWYVLYEKPPEVGLVGEPSTSSSKSIRTVFACVVHQSALGLRACSARSLSSWLRRSGVARLTVSKKYCLGSRLPYLPIERSSFSDSFASFHSCAWYPHTANNCKAWRNAFCGMLFGISGLVYMSAHTRAP